MTAPPMTPGSIPPNRGPQLHVVAGHPHLREFAPSHVRCACGHRCRGANAKVVADAFAAHRRAAGASYPGETHTRPLGPSTGERRWSWGDA